MLHDIAIFGAGGLGREVAMLIRQINQANTQWRVIGFFDDRDLTGSSIAGLPYLGNTDSLNNWPHPLQLVLALGDPTTKLNLIGKLTNPLLDFPVLCHPDSVPFSDQNVTIGPGSIICKGVILTVDISIGKHVLLNLATSVGHDACIGNFCSLMPGVRISGQTTLEDGVYIGTNGSVLNGLTIGRLSKIGAGAVVTRSLPQEVTAVGVPARLISDTNG